MIPTTSKVLASEFPGQNRLDRYHMHRRTRGAQRRHHLIAHIGVKLINTTDLLFEIVAHAFCSAFLGIRTVIPDNSA